MDDETFENIKKCYAGLGMLLERSVLTYGGNQHTNYLLTADGNPKTLNEGQLLSDARLKGFYQNPSQVYDPLENFPQNVDLQELKLRLPLKLTKDEFNLAFDALTLKDVISRTATQGGRIIGIARLKKELLFGMESKLFKEIRKYAPRPTK